VFAAPTATAGDIVAQYGVRALGRIGAVVERFYAITTERRMRDPATVAVFEAARRNVFGAVRPRPRAGSPPPSR
jgi:LysR family transcriptional activator of nhaA